MLDRLVFEFQATAVKAAFCSLFFEVPSHTDEHTIFLSPLLSGLVLEHQQIGRQKLRMRYRMSVIYGHPEIAATRALRFADHVTKRNGGSGDENAVGCNRPICVVSHFWENLLPAAVSAPAVAICLNSLLKIGGGHFMRNKYCFIVSDD